MCDSFPELPLRNEIPNQRSTPVKEQYIFGKEILNCREDYKVNFVFLLFMSFETKLYSLPYKIIEFSIIGQMYSTL